MYPDLHVTFNLLLQNLMRIENSCKVLKIKIQNFLKFIHWETNSCVRMDTQIWRC